MSTRPVHGSSLLLLLVLGSACGGASPSSPITPAKTISATAAGYLNAAVDIMAAHSLNRKSIDWSAVRQAVLQKAGAAQTIPDTYDAIVVGLGLLNDRHSFFEKPDGTTVTNPQAPTCADAPIVPPDPSALGTVRYIAVGTCQSPACSAAEYAQSLQARIAANDGPDVSGWIVDLRHNAGGNLWAMIGGVGPILGNGRLGDFVDADGNRTTFGYQDGTALYGSTAVFGHLKPLLPVESSCPESRRAHRWGDFWLWGDSSNRLPGRSEHPQFRQYVLRDPYGRHWLPTV